VEKAGGKSGKSKKWHHFGVAAAAAFMATLDSSIVNVALPTIARDFGADVKVVAWTVQAYLLTTMALLLVGGRLLDLWGERKVMAAGFAIFTAGSALCAMSLTVEMLIASRAFQGMGAAVLMSANQGLVARAFRPEERGRTLGMVGTVVSVGLASGPPLGGLLIGTLGWRSIFYINIPIGILAVAYCVRALGAGRRSTESETFDWVGSLLIVAGLASLFAGLDRGVDRGWSDADVLLLFASSLALLALFVLHERRTRSPLLDLSVFSNRFFVQSCAATFLVFFGMISAMILLPFYLQDVREFRPEKVGLLMMILPASMLLVAPLGGLISDKVGVRLPATFGLGLVGAGLLFLSGLESQTAVAGIVWPLALIGVGMGFFGSPNSSAILSSVAPGKVGAASGLSALMRTSGVAFGIAFAVTAFTYFRDRAASSRIGFENAPSDRVLLLEGIWPVFALAAIIVALNMINSVTRGRHPRAR